MNNLRIFFEIYFHDLPEPMSEIWEFFATYLRDATGLPAKWNIMQNGTTRRLKREAVEVGIEIDHSKLPGFHVNTRGHEKHEMSLSLGPIDSGLMHPDSVKSKGCMLRCSFEAGVKVPLSWAPLIERISSRWKTYGGYEFSQQYVGWQSTAWANDYEYFYGAIPPLMRRTLIPGVDALDPEKVRLNISKNPGRTSVIDGQFKAIAAEIWLGNDFWKYAPCTKEEVLAADFFLEIRDTPNFLYLKSWPHPFTRPDGEQGRVQQKLWRLLFHEDCEWPPGSGGISDDAVYGPPELLPDQPRPS